MKAAVGAVSTSLEARVSCPTVYVFFSVPQRKNRLEENRLDATSDFEH